MGKPKPETVAAAKAHRARANRVLDRQVIVPVREVWDEESEQLDRHLHRAVRGWTALDVAGAAALGAILSAWARRTSRRLAAEVSGSTRATLEEGVHSLAAYYEQVSGRRSPLTDAGTTRSVVDRRMGPLVVSQQQTTERLRALLESQAKARLGVLAAAETEPREGVTDVARGAQEQWWRVERVVRTETSLAFNTAQHDGIVLLEQAHRGVMKRWTERVDDTTRAPLDNKVGADSIAMHGQVTTPTGVFTMPKANNVDGRRWGMTFDFPPNRPNDRAILTPWVASWGVPGWVYRDV